LLGRRGGGGEEKKRKKGKRPAFFSLFTRRKKGGRGGGEGKGALPGERLDCLIQKGKWEKREEGKKREKGGGKDHYDVVSQKGKKRNNRT